MYIDWSMLSHKVYISGMRNCKTKFNVAVATFGHIGFIAEILLTLGEVYSLFSVFCRKKTRFFFTTVYCRYPTSPK